MTKFIKATLIDKHRTILLNTSTIWSIYNSSQCTRIDFINEDWSSIKVLESAECIWSQINDN